jgi:hypothetical protein
VDPIPLAPASAAAFATTVKWTRSTQAVPKDRRLLLIVASVAKANVPAQLDLVVGHWHEAREEFVLADVRHPFGRCRPELKIEWWAELPNLPEEIELRGLSDDDLWG